MIPNGQATRNMFFHYYITHYEKTERLMQFLQWIDLMIEEKISWERFEYVTSIYEDWNNYWQGFLSYLYRESQK